MISVIVPVYNSEKYLRRSIDSLLAQTSIADLELLFIDDGSTDNSMKILGEYSERYKSVRVFHQENKGVSSARNYGLREAKGDYIAFFDADDQADPRLYEKLLKLIKKYKADISVVDYSMCFADGTQKKHRKTVFRLLKDRYSVLNCFFKTNEIGINVFDKLFKRSIICDLSFPEGYAIGEDMYFMYGALKEADRVAINSRESLYKYMINDESAMTSRFRDSNLDAVRLAKKIAKDKALPAGLYGYAKANYIHEICKMLRIKYRDEGKNVSDKEVRSYIKDMKRYSLIKAMHYMSRKHFAALLLMKTSPALYDKVYNMLKLG